MVYMANELAVKVKVNLDSSGKALDDQLKNVEKYTTDHPVKVAVKIDKKSLENSLREAFGKDAANSIKKNLKNAVNVGDIGKNAFDSLINSMDEAAEKASKVSKLLNEIHKAQEKEKYYTTQYESLKGNDGRVNELELWKKRLDEVQAGYEALFTELEKLDSDALLDDKRFDSLNQQIREEKELYKVRREDAALRAGQKSEAATNKAVIAEIREQKAAIDSVIAAQEKLDTLQVKYYNELGVGRTDNAIELEKPILKAQTELEKTKDIAKAFGIDIEKDKRYMDALAESTTKVTIAQNNANDAISGAAVKEQLTQEKAVIDAVISALEKRDKLLVQKNSALKSGKTEDAARIQDLVDDANKELGKAIQNANSLGVAFRQDEQYIKAVNEGLVKVANAEQDVRRAENNAASTEKAKQDKANDSQRIKDLQEIVKLINEEAAANAQAEKARQSGNANSANDAEQRSIKASNEAVRLMADYQNKYNQSAMQTKEVNDAITSGLQQMKTAQAGVADAQAKSDATDAAKAEKEAIDGIVDALRRKAKAQTDYDNAVKSGDSKAQQDAATELNRQTLALSKAKTAADQLGVSWQTNKQYLDALYDSEMRTTTSATSLAAAQNKVDLREKASDAKAAADAVNAYAEANKNLIDAQRTGDKRGESFYSGDALQKQLEAERLLAQYEQKYGESATDNITILKALQNAFEKNTVAQNKYVNSVDEANKANALARASMEDYTNKANTSIRKLTENYGKFGISMTDVTQKYQAMEAEINKATQNGQEAEGLKKVIQYYKELGTAISAATAEGQRYNNRLNNKKGFDNISAELDAFVNQNPNLSTNAELWKQIQNLDAAVKSYSGTLEENQAAMAHVQAQAIQLGLTTETVGQKFMRLFKEHFQTAAVMAGIHLVQQGLQQVYQNVSEVDAAMTELKKVTDETDATYTNFLSGAGQSAKELGASISDIVNSTADFARLGYSLSDATELAKVATVYTHVGDDLSGIMKRQSLLSPR